MTRERIEDIREIVLPFVKKRLLEINYENLGKSDAEEFTRDFNEILDLAIKALAQESTTKNDLALIHTEGLDEEIRCTMCTNYMKSNRGCDGSCVVNKDMYKAVMDAIEKRIQPTTNNNQILEDIKDEILEQFWGDSRKEYFYNNDSKEYKEGAIETADYIIKMIDKHRK